ncbi:MAG: hypothetical protein AAF688_07250 [Bacteroidota bacterium]
MVTASLMLNIIILAFVCLGLITDSKRVQKTAGIFTPARGVLLAIYLTIALASLALLFIPNNNFIFSLLILQIVYKIMTPFTVRTLKNPIVISNLFIAVFHFITVYLMVNDGLIEF